MASVASQNLFALLGDDEDIEKVEKTNEAATTPQNETVLVQKQLDRSRASKKEARIKHDYPQRGGFKNSASRGNDDNRSGPRDLNVGPRLLSGRHEENDTNNYNNYNSNRDYPSRNSRGARPGERGRGGRRGDGGGRGGGREYDRHSASGRYDSEKKENQGWGFNNTDWEDKNKTNNNVKIDNNVNKNEFSANWESANNETAANDSSAWDNNVESQEPTNDWATKAENGGGGGGGEGEGGWNAGKIEDQSWEFKEEGTLVASEANDTKDDNIGDDEAATKPVEPEEIIKTLEEYLSEKAQKILDISLPEVRKPNEGVDDSQWKDAVPLEKKEEEDILFSGKEQSFKTKNKSKKLKNYLEIKPTFDKPGGFQRGGGGRGRGRGGGRGGGGGERNYDNRRGGGGGGERSYDNRDNRRGGGGGGGERNYRGGDGGGERNHDDYNNRRRGGDGGGNRGKYVNIDDQRAFPSLGTPV